MATAIEMLQGGGIDGIFTNSSKPISGGRYKFIYFQEDSVITTFTNTGGGNEKTLWNIGSETIKAGTILFGHQGQGIATITLASGSAFLFDKA